jgi:ComF family protein
VAKVATGVSSLAWCSRWLGLPPVEFPIVAPPGAIAVSVTTHLVAFGGALLDFLYPPHCPVCEAWQPPAARAILCGACVDALMAVAGPRCDRCSAPVDGLPDGSPCRNCAQWTDISFARAIVLSDFRGVAHDAIHGLKFNGIRQMGRFLGSRFAVHPDLQTKLAPLDLLIPVPLHGARQRERGYNQAEEIARGLASELHIPLVNDCLRRIRPTRQQAKLEAAERLENMTGAFAAASRLAASPHCIGLVDDVMTTGATLSACAEALRVVTGAQIIGLAIASPFRGAPEPITLT